jgi:hypothetical protein
MGKCFGTPDMPDYEEAAREGVYADLDTYPTRYMVDAASRMGVPITIRGETYDFTGLGDVDSSRVVSDKMAQTMLDIQRENSGRIIAQRLRELKAADPDGYSARKQLFDRIMASADENPDRPMAENLQNQITAELQNGGKLDSRGRDQVQEGVRGGQVRRGVFLGNAPIQQESAAMVQAGDQARDTRQQRALQFLESGISPEDVEYRRFQQALGNLGSFVNKETPTSQFKQLSGANNGAVPFIGGGPNAARINPASGAQGAAWASQVYQNDWNVTNSQTNPYMAGLSTAASGVNALASLGWSPKGSVSSFGTEMNNMYQNRGY